jgi:hypothetical protein
MQKRNLKTQDYARGIVWFTESEASDFFGWVDQSDKDKAVSTVVKYCREGRALSLDIDDKTYYGFGLASVLRHKRGVGSVRSSIVSEETRLLRQDTLHYFTRQSAHMILAGQLYHSATGGKWKQRTALHDSEAVASVIRVSPGDQLFFGYRHDTLKTEFSVFFPKNVWSGYHTAQVDPQNHVLSVKEENRIVRKRKSKLEVSPQEYLQGSISQEDVEREPEPRVDKMPGESGINRVKQVVKQEVKNSLDEDNLDDAHVLIQTLSDLHNHTKAERAAE